MGPLEGPLAERVYPFTQRRKGLIYRSAPACNRVFGKMSGAHELKKVVMWEIHLLIELASRKTWESKWILWWELGLLRGSVSCKEKTCSQISWVLLLLGELLASLGLSFLSCARHTFMHMPRPGVLLSIQCRSGVGLRFCISHRLLGNADAAGVAIRIARK